MADKLTKLFKLTISKEGFKGFLKILFDIITSIFITTFCLFMGQKNKTKIYILGIFKNFWIHLDRIPVTLASQKKI